MADAAATHDGADDMCAYAHIGRCNADWPPEVICSVCSCKIHHVCQGDYLGARSLPVGSKEYYCPNCVDNELRKASGSTSSGSASTSSRSAPPELPSAPAPPDARPSQIPPKDLYHIGKLDTNKLRPAKWYDMDKDNPVALVAMTIGTDYAIDPLTHDVLQKYVGTKGKKFGMKQGVPGSSPIALKRELLRRCRLLDTDPDEPRRMPKCANWDKERLEQELKVTIVPGERPTIVALLTNLCSALEEGADRVTHRCIYGQLRRFHALIHPSLRPDLVNRNRSSSARELDDRRSPSRPLNFYEKAAELYNSDAPLESVAMPDLPEPYNKANILPPPPPDKMAAAKDMSVALTNIRALVTSLQANFKKSGNGDGNIVQQDANGNIDLKFVDDNELLNFINGPGSKLTEVVVYYLKVILSQDGNLLEEVKQCLDRDAAATMTSVPEASESTRKRKKGDDKGRASDQVVSIMKEDMEMKIADQKLRKKEHRSYELASLRDQLVSAKRLAMEAHSRWIEAYDRAKELDEPGDNDSSSDAEDIRDIFEGKKTARKYRKEAEAQVKEIEERIQKYEQQVSLEEKAEEAEEEQRRRAKAAAAEAAATAESSSSSSWATMSDDQKRREVLEYVSSHVPPAGCVTKERTFDEIRQELCKERDASDLERILEELCDKDYLLAEATGFEKNDCKYLLMPEDNADGIDEGDGNNMRNNSENDDEEDTDAVMASMEEAAMDN